MGQAKEIKAEDMCQGNWEDYIKAYFWFSIRANGPAGEDKKNSAEILDILTGLMTDKQLAEGKRLLKEWRTKHKTGN